MFHRRFLLEFIPKFSSAVAKFFKSVPDPEIRKMKKERLDGILTDMDKLLHRVYTVMDKYEFLEHFELDMCTRFLKSNYLQVRIDGLKGINDILKIENKGLTRSITKEDLVDWAMKEKIVEELVGPKKHQQILQRSSALLQFIYSNLGFDKSTLEELWEFTKDELLRKDLFKILCEIAFPLHSPELEFFANQIITMDPSEVTEEALIVIFEPYKTPNHTNEQLLKYANIMATIAFSGKYSLEISESALQKYAEMVSTLDYDPYKKDILLYYITEMITKNKCVVLSIKLIRSILNQCIDDSTVGLVNTREDVINYLITEANLVQAFFDNLEWYYDTVKQGEKVIDRYDHSFNMAERIEFLSYLLTNCKPSYRLPIKHYYKLWDMLYESPVSEDDPDLLFIFLRCITSNSILVCLS
jgi:ubiquitin carboxyl-terminal hydrolase 34